MIGKALADDAAQSGYRAILIVAAQRFTVVVAELKLRNVAVQVLLLAVLIDALHAALEDRKCALNCVGVDRRVFIIDILARAVTAVCHRASHCSAGRTRRKAR